MLDIDSKKVEREVRSLHCNKMLQFSIKNNMCNMEM
jgi:hypothetical protein